MKRLGRLTLRPVTGLYLTGRALPLIGPWIGASRRRTLCTAGISVMLAVYALSPLMALWSINQALRSNDPALLASHIDWSALSANLKEQTIARLMGPPPEEDDLPDFGSSFATTAVSHAIDTRLTPTALIGMASRLMPQDGGTISWRSALHRASVWFEGPNRFRARIYSPEGATQAVVHLQFEHWRWQITRVDIPTA